MAAVAAAVVSIAAAPEGKAAIRVPAQIGTTQAAAPAPAPRTAAAIARTAAPARTAATAAGPAATAETLRATAASTVVFSLLQGFA